VIKDFSPVKRHRSGHTQGMVLFIAGVLIVAMAALGAAGRLPRNFLAGVRIPSTMRSDAAWVAGHRAAAAPLTFLGISVAVLGLWDMSSIGGGPPPSVPLLVSTVVFGAWATITAHRAARGV
jgi:hypothetical protein